MCIMYFYIFCSQTAVSWKLWFTTEAAFTQWHVADRDVLWRMVPSENHGAAVGSMTVLREGVFYLISVLNVWSACLGSPQTTCLAVLMCSCGMELRCNHGIVPSLYCAGTQAFLVDPCDVTAPWQEEFCPVCDWNPAWLFPAWRNGNRKALCLEKSLFNTVFLLMTLC